MSEKLRLVEAIRETLRGELDRSEDVVVYGQDVGVDGGVFRATQGLIEDFPNQVYDAPVAEAGIIGMGVGLGAAGFTPVPEIQFSDFAHQGFHQLRQHVARLRSRTRGGLTCPMTLRAPYGGGIHALEHHCESFEAGYAHVPGLKVVIPSTPADARGLLASAIRDPDPVIFLEPMPIYRATPQPVPAGDHTVPLGEAAVREAGEDVTVVAWGSMFREAATAAEAVEADVELVDLRTISPLDRETVLDSVRKTGRCVVVHEAPKTGGVGAEIAALVADEAVAYLEAPVERVAGYDVPYPLFAREDAYLPDAERIGRGIQRVVAF